MEGLFSLINENHTFETKRLNEVKQPVVWGFDQYNRNSHTVAENLCADSLACSLQPIENDS